MASGRAAFSFSFQWWLFIFVTVLLPLDLIYRAGALWVALPWYQIGIDFASLVVFFTLVALGIALASLVASVLLRLVTKQGTPIIRAVNGVIGLLILLISFVWYLYEWIKKISHILWNVETNLKYITINILVVLSLLYIIIYYKKYNFSRRITEISLSFFKFNIVTVLICLLIISTTILDNLFNKSVIARNYTETLKVIPFYKPNIILITFDALCAQHTSLHSFMRDTTPELVKFGRQSYVFNNMYSSCNWTLPSLASLLTGKQPLNHQMKNSYSIFIGNSQNENLPSILKEAGYETALSVANAYGIPWRIKLNGFDHVYSRMTSSEPINNILEFFYTSGITSRNWLNALNNESLFYKLIDRWLESPWFYNLRMHHSGMFPSDYITPEESFDMAAKFLSYAQQPFFLWIHIVPPHAPYVPRKNFIYTFLRKRIFDNRRNFSSDVRRFMKGLTYRSSDQPLVDKLSLRYDEHILYGDHEVGKFLSYLQEIGVYDRSIIIVTSDHGESFERNFWSHSGPFLYQCLIHVPLIIHLPGQTQGKRIEANVSHVDLAPTILDFLGIEAPPWMDGKSFKQALYDGRFNTGTKFSMYLYQMDPVPHFQTTSIAAIHGDYKLIKYLKFNQYEMYNLKNDPHEKNNLVGLEPERLFTLTKEIDEVLAPKRP